MPRKQSIGPDRRLQIFFDYRRLGKFYPVSTKNGVARSTVRTIVEEFLESGFSPKPRVSLSVSNLTQIQNYHLEEVIRRFRDPPEIHLVKPNEFGGRPSYESALDGDINVDQNDPLRLNEDLVWHLKGTVAESAIQEVRRAVRNHESSCQNLWISVSKVLTDKSGLRVRLWLAQEARVKEPHIFHHLVTEVYRSLFSAAGGTAAKPAPDWLNTNDQSDTEVLKSRGLELAAGGPEEQESVRQAVEYFLQAEFDAHARRARDLARSYDDLSLLQRVLNEALRNTTEEDIRHGICPSCPYPEVTDRAESNS